jgi:MYXO-CTERM domain-containing protein
MPRLTEGSACTTADDCASNACVDGVCCDSTCDGLCESCGTVGALGICAQRTAGTDPEDECAGEDRCDGMGGCAPPMMLPDAGPRPDSGPIAMDAGSDGGPVGFDAGGERMGGGRDDGCGCRVPGASGTASGVPLLGLLGLVGAAAIARRRRGDQKISAKSSPSGRATKKK